MEGAGDFVVRDKRPRKARLKKKAELSSDSEDDDFAPQAKKRAKHKIKVGEKKSQPPNGAKSKRLSRDEKLFNRDTLAKSANTSLSSLKPVTASSPSQPVDHPPHDPLDDSDYIPGSNKHSESDDEDFEPSPPSKKPKKAESKEKKKPVKKENVKTATKSAKAKTDKPSTKISTSTVRDSDLPGSKPLAGLSVAATGLQPKVGRQTPISPKVGLQTPISPKVGLQCPKVGLLTPISPKVGLQTPISPKVGLQTPISPDSATPVKRRGVAKWVPPARVGEREKGGITPVRSGGGAPVIRVGLSRKAPIKPLHPLHSPLQTKNSTDKELK